MTEVLGFLAHSYNLCLSRPRHGQITSSEPFEPHEGSFVKVTSRVPYRELSATNVESFAIAPPMPQVMGLRLKLSIPRSGVSSDPDPGHLLPPSIPVEEYSSQERRLTNTSFLSSPTTPALISSFPSTPPMALQSRQPGSAPVAFMSSDVLSVSKKRVNREIPCPNIKVQKEGLVDTNHGTPEDFFALEDFEDDEFDYALTLRSLVTPGPPPGGPVPPIPGPVGHSSKSQASYKNFHHHLDLDLSSLTRKLTTVSQRSSLTSVSSPSTGGDHSRFPKKNGSQSRIRSESTATNASAASLGYRSSITSSGTPVSTSSQSDFATSRRQKSLQGPPQLPIPPVPPIRQTSHRLSGEIAPLKLKEKSKKEKDAALTNVGRNRDDTNGVPPVKRFFSKYASVGSHHEKDAAALSKLQDRDDCKSIRSFFSMAPAVEEESQMPLSLAIPSSYGSQNDKRHSFSVKHTEQISPINTSPSSQSPNPTSFLANISPVEYTPQHIVPPAELLKMEKWGFVEDGGRSGDAYPDISPRSSPSLGFAALRNRSNSTTMVNSGSSRAPSKTRTHRAGSEAALFSPAFSSPSGGIRKLSVASAVSEPSKIVTSPRPKTADPTMTGLPPPPRLKTSLRSNDSLRGGISHSTGILSPPPRVKRPSTASSALQKHHSIMKKPSFLDIGDDDDDLPITPKYHHDTYSQTLPSRSRSSSTVSSGWKPKHTTGFSGSIDDSFLDMGKMSMDTIRSEEEEIYLPVSPSAHPHIHAVNAYSNTSLIPQMGSAY